MPSSGKPEKLAKTRVVRCAAAYPHPEPLRPLGRWRLQSLKSLCDARSPLPAATCPTCNARRRMAGAENPAAIGVPGHRGRHVCIGPLGAAAVCAVARMATAAFALVGAGAAMGRRRIAGFDWAAGRRRGALGVLPLRHHRQPLVPTSERLHCANRRLPLQPQPHVPRHGLVLGCLGGLAGPSSGPAGRARFCGVDAFFPDSARREHSAKPFRRALQRLFGPRAALAVECAAAWAQPRVCHPPHEGDLP